MVVWVLAWAVMWVAYLPAHSHAQLGVDSVGGGGGGFARSKSAPPPTTTTILKTTRTTTITTTTTSDRLIPRDHEEEIGGEHDGGGDGDGDGGGREVPRVVMADTDRDIKGWLLRPLRETYLGCFREESFNGTLMFVNLTQTKVRQGVTSKEEACFHLCLSKDPFSFYIAVSSRGGGGGGGGGGGDGCGCKDWLDTSTKVREEVCDEVQDHYRTYCGPSNFACLSRGGRHTTTTTTTTTITTATSSAFLYILTTYLLPYHLSLVES